MVTCPRCGGDAEYLTDTDEAFNLLRCEFCDDIIDVTESWHRDSDQVLRHAVDRSTQTLPSAPSLAPLRSRT
jgi:hypothetical protein